MNFIEELRWRGMVQDITPGTEEVLSEHKITGYVGFDPTSRSLTIGNYVPLMLLTLFQKHGHQPIVLMGGATGRIGDPSGKDEERELKSYEELDANLEHQKDQVRQFLDFEGDHAARFINNLDFYREMSVIDFLREVGKVLTVNYMLSKESVKRRLDSGISFTEFSYQLIQANDFLELYHRENCIFQMGGSDQWGNITSGTEFVRRSEPEADVYALTAPLLTKADGSKFGKSEEGNIWLDPEMTSPYQFYQFWINSDDRDLEKYLKYFSLKPVGEIRKLIEESKEDPRSVKRVLAEELTDRIHSEQMRKRVEKVSEILFNPKADEALLRDLDEDELQMIRREIPSFEVERALFRDGQGLIDLMAKHTGITGSKGEARRAIKGKAVRVNRQRITKQDHALDFSDLLRSRYVLIENGKKNKFLVYCRNNSNK